MDQATKALDILTIKRNLLTTHINHISMDTLILISGLAGIIQLIVIIVLIIKFFQIADDVKFIRNKLDVPQKDFKNEFYKWILANEPAKAKEVLFNEIGASADFVQLLKGGNETYLNEVKNRLNRTYKKELHEVGMDKIDFDKIQVSTAEAL